MSGSLHLEVILSRLKDGEYFNCEHEENKLVKKTNAGGNTVYQKQCLLCGRTFGSLVSKKGITVSPPEFDQLLYDECRKVFDKHDEERKRDWIERRLPERTALYQEYLQTPEWQSLRKRVLERDKYQCQACLQAAATRVHHLTYIRIFHEPCFDLVSVCEDCHDAIHKDKQ